MIAWPCTGAPRLCPQGELAPLQLPVHPAGLEQATLQFLDWSYCSPNMTSWELTWTKKRQKHTNCRFWQRIILDHYTTQEACYAWPHSLNIQLLCLCIKWTPFNHQHSQTYNWLAMCLWRLVSDSSLRIGDMPWDWFWQDLRLDLDLSQLSWDLTWTLYLIWNLFWQDLILDLKLSWLT